MKKILIYGITSFRNGGVEALFQSTLAQIDKDVSVVTAIFDMEYHVEKYRKLGVRFVDHHRMNEEEFSDDEKKLYEHYQQIPFDYYLFECLYERDVIREMEDADVCIHVGGDNYCYGASRFLYAINRKAKELGKKTVLWGASLFDELTDRELIEDLKRYDLLMLRESISYQAIRPYVSSEKLLLIPDPAFSLPKKKVSLNKWYRNRKVIGLNLSPLTVKTEENREAIDRFIQYILEKTDYSIALLSHVIVEEASDLKVLEPLYEKYKEEERIFLEDSNYDCEELKYIISQCEFLVAARTHASIAAYSTFVPTLVIGYSVKSRGIAEEIFGNYKNYVLPTEDLQNDELIQAFLYIEKHQQEIKNILKKNIKDISEKAKSIYSLMQQRLQYLEESYVCPVEKCTGCSACYNICPVGAISFVNGEGGFSYPKIDLEKCIHCGLCRKHCCIQNEKRPMEKEMLTCYACKAKDLTIRKKSSSGGVFPYLAKYILQNDGVVYGASLENLKVCHIRVECEKDLEKLSGSKYVQSNLDHVFQQVKKDLEDGKKVLFSGTPCQILGLRMFLEKDYEFLYTASVICHGVPSPELFQKQLAEISSKFSSPVFHVSFKDKKTGWERPSMIYQMERMDKCYFMSDDSYIYLFLHDYILRESCYRCPAKGVEHNLSDIVLGDYWGIYHVHREFHDDFGTSAVMLKTTKGKFLFDQVKENFYCVETKYEDIVKYNPSFVQSMDRPMLRNTIFHELENNTLSLVAKYCQLRQENEKLEKLTNLQEENKRLQEELVQVYQSKRLKFANKVFGVVDKGKKIIRRK